MVSWQFYLSGKSNVSVNLRPCTETHSVLVNLHLATAKKFSFFRLNKKYATKIIHPVMTHPLTVTTRKKVLISAKKKRLQW